MSFGSWYIANITFFIFSHPAKNVGEKTLTIVFHAILSKNFLFDDGMKIVIRGDEPIFKGGWERCNIPVNIEG